MKKFPLLFLCALLTGCAAIGPEFTPAQNSSPDAAIVYIYRKNAFALGARAAYFYIDDVNIFDLNTGNYSWVELPAGNYQLKQKWAFDMLARPLVVKLNVAPRQKKYFSFNTGICPDGYRQICWQLQEEPAEKGQIEIQTYKFQDNFGASNLMQKIKSSK